MSEQEVVKNSAEVPAPAPEHVEPAKAPVEPAAVVAPAPVVAPAVAPQVKAPWVPAPETEESHRLRHTVRE